ncbi:hypothetical protein [Obesumbacterium proteus]|uniref:hypothetical protein n=1 Tax=Obesumbacterium proteus TaxID=82983 RepID=UPI00187D1310|nr:hypothetical protein [Obesumbacterium proteus]MCE9886640.1 hypothetical protein [Obesumbacterium proteus]MCE9918004.1 hypothetical protein [Obesumbacterium proteus]MCE9929377.1 hypothetical protein [Obesumbacterium proteus]MCG2877435.1 hypothetical protein [Obesumbacterium proteus]
MAQKWELVHYQHVEIASKTVVVQQGFSSKITRTKPIKRNGMWQRLGSDVL